jgi:CheY-like chemotaxis protein
VAEFSILVVSPVRALRRALVAFLQDIPGVCQVEICSDLPAVLAVLEARRLDVMVLDADVVDIHTPISMASFLMRLRRHYPELNLVVLVDSVAQEAMCLTAGASHALHKGQLDQRLAKAVAGGNMTQSPPS